ncbi:MAG: hypothetical protein LBR08_04240 [Bacteroidales bacterium]|jgi:hypothetical protein|nr:hypothetical protein [Bacteroidales bacterium]
MMRTFTFCLCVTFGLLSCDSGDIYPDEYRRENGIVVKASFSFLEPETFPASYQLLFGAFNNEKIEPVISKTIIKPADSQPVVITLSNLPAEAVSLKLCLTTLGKQPVYTFYETDVPASVSDSIIIPLQEIHLLQYDRVQQQIFSISCVACHGNPGAAGLSLLAGVSYDHLVNQPALKATDGVLRVKPADVDNSFLIRILEQDGLLATDHTPIPSKYDDDLALLKEWIRQLQVAP